MPAVIKITEMDAIPVTNEKIKSIVFLFFEKVTAMIPLT